jgi:hypothetical protein
MTQLHHWNLCEKVTVAFLFLNRALEEVLNALVDLSFPKIAHALSRPFWQEIIHLNLLPESGASSLGLIRESQSENLARFSDRVRKIRLGEADVEASFLYFECQVFLGAQQRSLLDRIDQPVGLVDFALEVGALLGSVLEGLNLVSEALMEVGQASAVVLDQFGKIVVLR